MLIRKAFSSILIILSILCVSFFAQSADKSLPYNADKTLSSNVEKTLPYKVGESLEYEGKYSKLILRGIDIATLNFNVENIPDSRNFIVKAEAKSQGGLIKLFNIKFQQNIESTVDGKNLQILRTTKRDEQDERVRVSEALFNYNEKKVSYIESDPNNTASPPRVVASSIESKTQDIISAIYMLRHAPLVVGETFEMTVSDSGLVYKIPVRVTKREERKSVLGEKWCFRVEPEIFGKNRLIDKDGDLVIWITDDDERIPVRANLNTDIGKVVVKLKKYSNGSNPSQATK
jgi:hypothetical protein